MHDPPNCSKHWRNWSSGLNKKMSRHNDALLPPTKTKLVMKYFETTVFQLLINALVPCMKYCMPWMVPIDVRWRTHNTSKQFPAGRNQGKQQTIWHWTGRDTMVWTKSSSILCRTGNGYGCVAWDGWRTWSWLGQSWIEDPSICRSLWRQCAISGLAYHRVRDRQAATASSV